MAEELEGEEFPEQAVPPMIQVDMGLSPLQSVVEWAAEGNPPGQRVAYILSIPAAAAESSLGEAREVLLPLLSQLAFDDHPDIKQATAEVLGPLGPILASKDPGAAERGSDDAMDLLVLAHRLLQDPERGIQEAAATSVAQFAGLLSEDHRREHLSAVVDALMHNFDDEQMQECAVDLLTKVAAVAGPQHPGWCVGSAVPRMLKLALHRDYGIRVAVVAGLVELAGCVPERERTDLLLPAFADLCNDQVWSVRQDCASELSALAARLPRDVVREQLLPLWQALAGDVSAWVQAAARRQAGPLLSSIHPEDCAPALLEAFAAAAAGPATLTEACAHYLPAVLRNLGMERWPQLREAVSALAASEYVTVRVALAESIHELAQLAGPQAVAQDVLPVIQRLSADEHPAVADALAANIASLLRALPRAERLAQLGFLSRMHPEDGSSCGQWRMRLLIAQQLAEVAALLEGQGLSELLLPATLRLCEDPVAAVREAAAAQLGGMVRRLLEQAGSDAGDADDGAGALQGTEPAQAAAAAAEQQAGATEAAEQVDDLAAGMQQLAVADPQAAVGEPAPAGPQAGEQRDGAEGPAAGQQGAAADPAASTAAQQQEQQQQAEEEMEEANAGGRAAGAPAAVVQQIVRHMVELQRSVCHRSRQTYLLFCSALLLWPAAETQQAQQGQQQQGEQGGAAEDGAPAQPAAEPVLAAEPPAGSALPAGVASSGIVQGLLEAAVALAFDPVPNVRIGVARLLVSLRRQQPQLAGSCASLAPALASLASDADRDVQQAAAEPSPQ